MLCKASVHKKVSICINCAVNGRKYHEGHAVRTSFTRASHAVRGIENRTVDREAKVEPKSLMEDNFSEEVKHRLQVTLGQTSSLLESAYAKGRTFKQSPLSSGLWNTSLQMFDVRFGRGPMMAFPKTDLGQLAKEEVENLETMEAPGLSSITPTLSVYHKHEYEPKRLPPLPTTESRVPQTDVTHQPTQLQQIRTFEAQMLAYTNMCIQRGELDDARSCLNVYMFNGHQANRMFQYQRVITVDAPNLLLKAYGDENCLEKAFGLYDAITDVGIRPNTETYIWLLWAAVKSDNPKANAEKVLKLMGNQNSSHLLRDAINDLGVGPYRTQMSKIRREMSLYPGLWMAAPKKSAESCHYRYSNRVFDNLDIPQSFRNPFSGVVPLDKAATLMERHFDTESKGEVCLETINPTAVPTKATLKARERYKAILENWRSCLKTNFESTLERSSHSKTSHSSDMLGRFLRCIPVDECVNFMLNEVVKLCEMSSHFEPPQQSIAKTLGQGMRMRYVGHCNVSLGYTEKLKDTHLKYIDRYNAARYENTLGDMYKEVDSEQLLEQALGDVWPTGLTQQVGRTLYNVIMMSVKVPADLLQFHKNKDASVPAFSTVSQTQQNGRTAKITKPHPAIAKLIKAAQLRRLFLPVEDVPMFVPPVPWQNENKGVFLQTRADLVRRSRGNYFEKTATTDMLPVFDALNVISSVPWIINSRIYSHILQVYNEGGDTKLKIPIVPERVVIPSSMRGNDNHTERDVMKLRQKMEAEAHSERCSFELGLSVANYCKDDIFWLPHSMDFRGRAYALSAHLNVTSADPRRALLKYAKGKPLGTRGLEWLKIHLVNLSGFKKHASNADRLAYADEVLPLAFQSAATPFEGKQWWKSMDSPWQGLAACLELKDAYDSGDPTSFVSHLPLNQDGSCNGLQHYAALGRDPLGAVAVNLLPSDAPHDTYTDIKNMVEKLRVADAAKGHKLAIKLEGRITRKVVKQSIMTKVYGVTPYGMRLQIRKHLSAQATDAEDMNFNTTGSASSYIAQKLADTMATMFKSSTEIQDWFTQCAHILTTAPGKPMTWVTPLGLSVTQNYWARLSPSDRKKLSSNIDVFQTLQHNYMSEKPDRLKQKNAFPPNFVHSLDATHMMITALLCHTAGLTFTSIHDCFCTHACDVDTMNKMCRDAFYELYQQPILEDLSKYFLKMYPEETKYDDVKDIIANVPKKGDLDLELVKKSKYFFS